MTYEPDSDILKKIGALSDNIRQRRRFEGYAGWPRMISGAVALAGACILHVFFKQGSELTHLIGWGIVLTIALALNYGHLAWWFFGHEEIRHRPAALKPALDALPPLAAGAIISAALIMHQQFNLLMGVWILMYGLAQTTYQGKLPKGVYFTGLVYMACGVMLLLFSATPFTNPWPMGLIFFIGELAGGLCLMEPE
jgi:hypothetical protein